MSTTVRATTVAVALLLIALAPTATAASTGDYGEPLPEPDDAPDQPTDAQPIQATMQPIQADMQADVPFTLPGDMSTELLSPDSLKATYWPDLAVYTRYGGLATYMNAGLMETARINHGLPPCLDCLGTIALLTDEHFGKRVYLQRVGEAPEGPYYVGDCSGEGLPFPRWLLEVDWQTSRRWEMAAPIYITLWLKESDDEYNCTGDRPGRC